MCSTAMAIDQAKDTIKVCSKSCVQSGQWTAAPLPRSPVVGGGNGTSLRFFLHDFFYWKTNPKLCQCWLSIVSDFFLFWSIVRFQMKSSFKMPSAMIISSHIQSSISSQLESSPAWCYCDHFQPMQSLFAIWGSFACWTFGPCWAFEPAWASTCQCGFGSLNHVMNQKSQIYFFSGRPSQWESLS